MANVYSILKEIVRNDLTYIK